jgi:hypothetical protein
MHTNEKVFPVAHHPSIVHGVLVGANESLLWQ